MWINNILYKNKPEKGRVKNNFFDLTIFDDTSISNFEINTVIVLKTISLGIKDI